MTLIVIGREGRAVANLEVVVFEEEPAVIGPNCSTRA